MHVLCSLIIIYTSTTVNYYYNYDVNICMHVVSSGTTILEWFQDNSGSPYVVYGGEHIRFDQSQMYMEM